jgi:hypothetical protein
MIKEGRRRPGRFRVEARKDGKGRGLQDDRRMMVREGFS